MPVLVDPETVLPDKKKRPAPSQVIAWLLYPVVLLVGVSVGIAIGIKEAPDLAAERKANRNFSNATIVPNANLNNTNSRTNTNTSANANGNTNIGFLNTNIFKTGDSGKIDAATEAKLQATKQTNLSKLVDKTASMADVLRQQDLMDLQYSLNAYFAVRNEYPTTEGQPIHLDRSAKDVFYTAMKEFYGGTYYEKIDPDNPNYYYGYKSDGETYSLSCYLVSKKKAFIVSSDTTE